MTPHSLQKNGQAVVFRPEYSSPLALLEHWAKVSPKKTALLFDDYSGTTPQQWNFAELVIRVKQTMSLLGGRPPDAAVAFCFSNTPEVIWLNYAAWSSGFISVPLDSTRDTTERKIYKLQQTKATLLFTRADEKSHAENEQIQQALPELEIIELADLAASIALLDQQKTISKTPEIDPNKPALVLYTSGTTALPKGALLTYTSLFANAASIAEWLQFGDDDRWMVVLPLHHINSTTFVNTTYSVGGTVVLVPAYSKSKFWPTLAQHSVTGTSVVPTIAFDQVGEEAAYQANQQKLSQVRRIQIGSAPVQPTTVLQFVKKFGIKLCQGYGQTETSLRSTGLPMDLAEADYLEMVERNSIGTELAFTNVTVLRADGSEADSGEVGDICVRGPIIMQEYLDNQAATEEAFKFNWFHSGDLGYWEDFTNRRFFYLKGRSKEIIKKGGVLISPLAIENALLKQYSELKQVFVIGYPDARMGESIGFVAVSDNPQMVETILSDAKAGKIPTLKPFELPEAGLPIQSEALPLTSTGKVQRVEIKKQFADQLAKQAALIAETDRYQFRLIQPNETTVLEQAVTINNARWGEHLAATLEELTDRAAHGVLIGLFDKSEPTKLLGSVSGLQIDQQALTAIGTPNHWANTWDGITDHGHLYHHSPKGDALVLVAISTASAKATPVATEPPSPITPPPPEEVEAYCRTGSDPVLSFHGRAKGGLSSGATVQTIIPNARVADWEACGYCVLMAYPPLKAAPTISTDASPGTQLLESALLHAYQHSIPNVFAYSRPAGLYQHCQQH